MSAKLKRAAHELLANVDIVLLIQRRFRHSYNQASTSNRVSCYNGVSLILPQASHIAMHVPPPDARLVSV